MGKKSASWLHRVSYTDGTLTITVFGIVGYPHKHFLKQVKSIAPSWNSFLNEWKTRGDSEYVVTGTVIVTNDDDDWWWSTLLWAKWSTRRTMTMTMTTRGQSWHFLYIDRRNWSHNICLFVAWNRFNVFFFSCSSLYVDDWKPQDNIQTMITINCQTCDDDVNNNLLLLHILEWLTNTNLV